MKLSNTHSAAELSGIQGNAFGVQMNAKMYSIMIDKLYKYKEAAVIRELSCNALDSHRFAGKADVPFDIKLPTWLDRSFSIRDYGTGIDPLQFEDIYTNIGASTKEDSNDDIGAYGLGSKTPFTMTDTYTIENYYEGRKHVYMCYKSDGFPQVSHIGSEDTDEPNGLKVSLAFDKGDIDEFKRQLRKQLMFFKVKPNVTGIEDPNWLKIPDTTENWFFINDPNVRSYSNASYVVMGGVCYPFELTEVDHRLASKLRGKSIVFKAGIGDVDIPPSRETIELTDKSKMFIKASAEHVINSYRKGYLDGLQKCGTYVDALSFYYNNKSDLAKVDSNEDITLSTGKVYKYGMFTGSLQVDGAVVNLRKLMLNYVQPLGSPHTYRWQTDLVKNDGTKVLVYVNDIDRSLTKILRASKDLFTESHTYIVTDGSWLKKEIAAESKKAYNRLKELGANVKYLSEIITTQVAKAAVVRPRVPVKQVFTVKDSVMAAYGLAGNTKEYKEKDIPASGYYVEIKGWSGVGYDNLVRTLGKLRDTFECKEPIYCIRSKSLTKVNTNLKPLKDLIDSYKADYLECRDQATKHQTLRTFVDDADFNIHTFHDLEWTGEKDYVKVASWLKKQDTACKYGWSEGTFKLLYPDDKTSLLQNPKDLNIPNDVKKSLGVLQVKYSLLVSVIRSTWSSQKTTDALEKLKNLINS